MASSKYEAQDQQASINIVDWRQSLSNIDIYHDEYSFDIVIMVESTCNALISMNNFMKMAASYDSIKTITMDSAINNLEAETVIEEDTLTGALMKRALPDLKREMKEKQTLDTESLAYLIKLQILMHRDEYIINRDNAREIKNALEDKVFRLDKFQLKRNGAVKNMKKGKATKEFAKDATASKDKKQLSFEEIYKKFYKNLSPKDIQKTKEDKLYRTDYCEPTTDTHTYFVLCRIYDDKIILMLKSIGVEVNCLVKLSSQILLRSPAKYTESEKRQNLEMEKFWQPWKKEKVRMSSILPLSCGFLKYVAPDKHKHEDVFEDLKRILCNIRDFKRQYAANNADTHFLDLQEDKKPVTVECMTMYNQLLNQVLSALINRPRSKKKTCRLSRKAKNAEKKAKIRKQLIQDEKTPQCFEILEGFMFTLVEECAETAMKISDSPIIKKKTTSKVSNKEADRNVSSAKHIKPDGVTKSTGITIGTENRTEEIPYATGSGMQTIPENSDLSIVCEHTTSNDELHKKSVQILQSPTILPAEELNNSVPDSNACMENSVSHGIKRSSYLICDCPEYLQTHQCTAQTCICSAPSAVQNQSSQSSQICKCPNLYCTCSDVHYQFTICSMQAELNISSDICIDQNLPGPIFVEPCNTQQCKLNQEPSSQMQKGSNRNDKESSIGSMEAINTNYSSLATEITKDKVLLNEQNVTEYKTEIESLMIKENVDKTGKQFTQHSETTKKDVFSRQQPYPYSSSGQGELSVEKNISELKSSTEQMQAPRSSGQKRLKTPITREVQHHEPSNRDAEKHKFTKTNVHNDGRKSSATKK